jgi:hypothetical protein
MLELHWEPSFPLTFQEACLTWERRSREISARFIDALLSRDSRREQLTYGM